MHPKEDDSTNHQGSRAGQQGSSRSQRLVDIINSVPGAGVGPPSTSIRLPDYILSQRESSLLPKNEDSHSRLLSILNDALTLIDESDFDFCDN